MLASVSASLTPAQRAAAVQRARTGAPRTPVPVMQTTPPTVEEVARWDTPALIRLLQAQSVDIRGVTERAQLLELALARVKLAWDRLGAR